MNITRLCLLPALLAFSVLLTGCCLDVLVPMPVTPVATKAVVSFSYKGGKPMVRELSYERFYDAQCSSRGSSWTIREVGRKNESETGTLTVVDPVIGTIGIETPAARDLFGPQGVFLYQLGVTINGEPYFHESSRGNAHTYFRRKHPASDVRERVVLVFVMKVNGNPPSTVRRTRESVSPARLDRP